MGDLATALIVLSERVHLLPKRETVVVKVSLVWESNAGFSMRHLTNTHRCCLKNTKWQSCTKHACAACQLAAGAQSTELHIYAGLNCPCPAAGSDKRHT